MEEIKLGRIYKITSPQTDKIYIGSTIKELKLRFREHRSDYNRYRKNKFKYVSSFDLIKYDDAVIELIEELNCSKKELHARERFYIELNKDSTTNKNIPSREHKESCKVYYNNNKDILNQKHKEYNNSNKERRKEYWDDYYNKNKEVIYCECGGKYIKCSSSKHAKTKKHINYITINITINTENATINNATQA